jgi:dihydrofolate reductase
MKLTASMMVTLDGVYQGPGGPDEDRRGGFDRGGWTAAYADPDAWPFLTSWFERADALLLGRKTWEIWEPYWPLHDSGDPVSHGINVLPKYVPSTTLKDPTWQNTHVISGDVETAIRELKAQPGREAPGPRQRRAAPVAARARPRRRAQPADLPGHRGRRATPLP